MNNQKDNKSDYFWASLRTPLGKNFDAGLATGDPRPSDRIDDRVYSV